jgi:hypothetical protein
MGDKDSFTKISCGIPKEIQQKKKLFLFRFPKDVNLSFLCSFLFSFYFCPVRYQTIGECVHDTASERRKIEYKDWRE